MLPMANDGNHLQGEYFIYFRMDTKIEFQIQQLSSLKESNCHQDNYFIEK